MLADAQNPAYHQMNELSQQAEAQGFSKTPEQNFEELLAWLRVLVHLGVDLRPDRSLPPTEINIL